MQHSVFYYSFEHAVPGENGTGILKFTVPKLDFSTWSFLGKSLFLVQHSKLKASPVHQHYGVQAKPSREKIPESMTTGSKFRLLFSTHN